MYKSAWNGHDCHMISHKAIWNSRLFVFLHLILVSSLQLTLAILISSYWATERNFPVVLHTPDTNAHTAHIVKTIERQSVERVKFKMKRKLALQNETVSHCRLQFYWRHMFIESELFWMRIDATEKEHTHIFMINRWPSRLFVIFFFSTSFILLSPDAVYEHCQFSMLYRFVCQMLCMPQWLRSCLVKVVFSGCSILSFTACVSLNPVLLLYPFPVFRHIHRILDNIQPYLFDLFVISTSLSVSSPQIYNILWKLCAKYRGARIVWNTTVYFNTIEFLLNINFSVHLFLSFSLTLSVPSLHRSSYAFISQRLFIRFSLLLIKNDFSIKTWKWVFALWWLDVFYRVQFYLLSDSITNRSATYCKAKI